MVSRVVSRMVRALHKLLQTLEEIRHNSRTIEASVTADTRLVSRPSPVVTGRFVRMLTTGSGGSGCLIANLSSSSSGGLQSAQTCHEVMRTHARCRGVEQFGAQ